jgi:hypothetical protein
MTMRHGGVVLAGMLALAGCGNPKDANKPNLAKALDKHFVSHCLYVTPSVGLTAYPASIDEGTDTTRFDALAAAGLLTAASASAEHPGPLGIGSVRSETKTYSLTDAGRAVFQPATGGFCAGHYTVKSIESFTAPTPQDGRTVVLVSYTVTPHLENWTTNEAVQDRYGAQFGSVQETTDRATLVLTDDGWVVQGD